MTNRPGTTVRAVSTAVLLALSVDAPAINVSADGQGQALIFPYYTVRSNVGNPFNTYLSIVNTRTTAKALRVRFREARNGREAAAFNLFLSPNDMWTGAIVPDGEGARLVSTDQSCVQPAFGPVRGQVAAPQGLPFSNAAYSGSASDNAGEGLDRMREGYVEVLEMAELTGAARTQATHNADLFPSNCQLLSAIAPGDLTRPDGGITGTLTLINVASGQDFTVAAQALDNLARQPYYRPASDPYPAFTANEIDPVTLVEAKGAWYRSMWPQGLDAVNAALIRHPQAEYAIDSAAAGATEMIFTFPTRYASVTAAASSAPFFGRPWQPKCGIPSSLNGEDIGGSIYDRETRPAPFGDWFDGGVAFWHIVCGSANVLTIASRGTTSPRRVVASQAATSSIDFIPVNLGIENGWARVIFGSLSMTSEATSTRTDIATGISTTGRHTYTGLPVVGLVMRSLTNGFLDCGGKLCQGNYGGSFPMSYTRAVLP